MAAFVAPMTMRELYEQALARRLMMAPVAHAQMIDEDPQLAAREYFVWHHHVGLGKDLPLPGAFAKCRPAPLHVARPAPRLGEHNRELLGREVQPAPESGAAPGPLPRPPIAANPVRVSCPRPSRRHSGINSHCATFESWI